MTELYSLPLFPLNTVLFPGMTLPLHIFEPRYRVMIKRCLKLNRPFGVVLIREGSEVGGGAVPHDIGTSAYVTHAQPLDNGRMNIQAVGYKRFRLVTVEQERPFLVGRVADFPLEGLDSPEVEPLAGDVRKNVRTYVDMLAEMTDQQMPLGTLPEDAQALAYLIGMSLPLSLEEKQGLLTTRDLPGMLRSERTLLRRELMLLGQMIRHQEQRRQSDMPFSQN